MNQEKERVQELTFFESEEEKETCDACGKDVYRYQVGMLGEGEDGRIIAICEDCEDDFEKCADCGRIIHIDNLYCIESARYGAFDVCEECLENYETCNDCGNYYMPYEMYSVNDEYDVCSRCWRDYYMCYECGRVIHEGDIHQYEGYGYCEECYNNLDCDMLHEYDYKPEPKYKGEKNAIGYYGCELEIDCGDPAVVPALADISADIYCKHDGSLSSKGVEIVTHPATLDYHLTKMNWKKICKTAYSYGYSSHDTTTCGLHIHASRSLFGMTKLEQDLNIAKVLLYIDRHWDKVVKFSRRTLKSLNNWARKPNLEADATVNENEILNKVEEVKQKGRYQAVNLTNISTVEFRMFRGTLKYTTILASLQFVDTLIKKLSRTPLEKALELSWEDVFEKSEGYLREYLISRGLLENSDAKKGVV